MDIAQGLNPDSFGVVSMFLQADWIVRLVMIGLLLASIWSWTIIIERAVRLATLNRDADLFEDQVATGRPLDEVAGDGGPAPSSPMARIIQPALREWREVRGRGALNSGQIELVIDRVDRVLQTGVAKEARKIETGLASLSIVATASPFVGLFGTVWGIMHAFQSIALERNTSLAVVAPAIAEALFATALGLIAAIPAYVAYNKFSADLDRFNGRLESFADDVGTLIHRRLSDLAAR